MILIRIPSCACHSGRRLITLFMDLLIPPENVTFGHVLTAYSSPLTLNSHGNTWCWQCHAVGVLSLYGQGC